MSGGADDEFDAFYQARAESLVRLLYLRTGDLTRAQDCVQEAFTRAWLKWSALQGGDDPVAWVRKVAWNLAVTDWRRERRSRAREERMASGHPAATEDVVVAEVVAVRAALRELPGHQQTVVLLHYYEGLSLPEISALTGKPVGTLKSSLHRARGAMRDYLEVDERDPQGPVREENR